MTRLWWLVALVVVLCCLTGALAANAAPFEIHPRNAGPYRVGGYITLRDPHDDHVLGNYEFVTGGCGRGAAPWGKYEIGEYLNAGWIGPRWFIRHQGLVDGLAYDSRIHDVRFDLELHAMHVGHWKCTLGCIGIFGSGATYSDFKTHLRYLIAYLGTVTFDFEPPIRMAR